MASAPSGSRKSRCIMPLASYRSRKSPIDSFDQAYCSSRDIRATLRLASQQNHRTSFLFLITPSGGATPIRGNFQAKTRLAYGASTASATAKRLAVTSTWLLSVRELRCCAFAMSRFQGPLWLDRIDRSAAAHQASGAGSQSNSTSSSPLRSRRSPSSASQTYLADAICWHPQGAGPPKITQVSSIERQTRRHVHRNLRIRS